MPAVYRGRRSNMWTLRAAEFRPDAVFLDIGLPGINGYDVACGLRKIPGIESVILIAFTGYGQEEDRRRILGAGFDHHMTKPASAAEVREIVEGLPVRP